MGLHRLTALLSRPYIDRKWTRGGGQNGQRRAVAEEAFSGSIGVSLLLSFLLLFGSLCRVSSLQTERKCL